MTPTRIVTALLAAAALFISLLAAPAAAYAPGGGRWNADGTGPTYHPGIAVTGPSRAGVRAYQHALNIPKTGIYDETTRVAVLRHQQARPWLRNTGHIDFPTSRNLLAPEIMAAARAAGISPRLLCGHLWAESRLDPQAVGPGGGDYGIAQIVPRYKPGTYPWDAQASIWRMAHDDAQAIKKYGMWGVVAWWKPEQARIGAAGHAQPEAWAYVNRIRNAPCGGFPA